VGVYADLAVVERPRAEGVKVLPGLALVVGAEDAAVLGAALAIGDAAAVGRVDLGLVGLHHGVDDVGILAVDVDAATAVLVGGQALGHLLPRFAAVGGLVEARVGPVQVGQVA